MEDFYKQIVAPVNSQRLPPELVGQLDTLDQTYTQLLADLIEDVSPIERPDHEKAKRIAHAWYDEELGKILGGHGNGQTNIETTFDPAAQVASIEAATERAAVLAQPRERVVTTLDDIEIDDDFDIGW